MSYTLRRRACYGDRPGLEAQKYDGHPTIPQATWTALEFRCRIVTVCPHLLKLPALDRRPSAGLAGRVMHRRRPTRGVQHPKRPISIAAPGTYPERDWRFGNGRQGPHRWVRIPGSACGGILKCQSRELRKSCQLSTPLLPQRPVASTI